MKFKKLFSEFNSKRVLVIGDVMIDAYLMGKVNRVSPEAPVPIVSLSKHEDRLGGAANVALNLVALGAKPVICSVIGNDNEAKTFLNLLKEAGISDNGLVLSNERKTTVKTRVLGNNQHLLRIDSEQTNLISEQEENALIEKVSAMLEEGIDAVIFEDYNKGVLTPRVIHAIIQKAKAKKCVVTVDPKKDHFFEYQGVTLFKPNLKELKEGTGIDFDFTSDPSKFNEAIEALENKLQNEISFVTLSEHGVFIKNQSENHLCPAHIRNIADVSGAGDTVISVATLCLIAGASLKHVAEISNIAGGLVCESSGVVSINKEELLAEIEQLIKA